MNKISKVVAVLLIFLAAGFPISFPANAARDNLQEARGVIDAISDIGQYFPEDMTQPMTRGAFVQSMAALFGECTATSNIRFTDVETDSLLYNSLEMAVALQWITNADIFNPDVAISTDEAAKICCYVAGYDVQAKLMGGYPTGYQMAARQSGILSSNVKNGSMSGNDALQIIWNTLNTDVLKQTAFGTENAQFSAAKGDTLLSIKFDVYYTSGILNANEYTTLGNIKDKGKSDRIEIDGVEFYSNNTYFNKYIGYSVRGYYRQVKEDSKRELMFVYPFNNQVLSLNAGDINFNPSAKTIEYGDTEIIKAKLNSTIEYIYNGRVYYGSSEDMIPQSGNVTLIDNDDDGDYDIISAVEYYYMSVKVFNKYYMTVSDQWDKTKTLDLNKADLGYFLTDIGGKPLSPLNLKKGDMLAVASSKDDLLIHMILCEDGISGTLDEKIRDDKKLVVSNQIYNVSPEIAKVLDTFSVGKSYQYILGINGEIANIISNSSEWFYAYMKNAKLIGLDKTLNMDIFTDSGEHMVVECTKKIKVKGKSISSESIYGKLAPNDIVEPQLIRCVMNDEGKVYGIALSETVTAFPLTDETADDILNEYDFGVTQFYSRQNHFYPYFNSVGSVVFKVPTDMKKKSLFKIGHSFSDGNVSVIPYDVKSSGSAGAIVYVSDAATVPKVSTTPIMLIEKVFTTLNAEGYPVKAISGWSDGIFTEFFIDEDVNTSDLASGNVIHYLAQDGTILNYATDFIGSTLTVTSAASDNFNMTTTSAFSFIGGQVFITNGDFVYLAKIKNADGLFDTSIVNLINTKIPTSYVVYDIQTKKIRMADKSYISSIVSDGAANAAYMLIRSDYLQNRYGIIYQP